MQPKKFFKLMAIWFGFALVLWGQIATESNHVLGFIMMMAGFVISFIFTMQLAVFDK